MAVQDTGQKPLALTRSIDFFGPEARTISAIAQDYMNNRSPHAQFLSTHRSVRLQFARLHGSSNGSASREIRFFVRATAYERHFRCRAQAHLAIFFSGTRSRLSSERACWIGDVRSVFVFCFCFLMFVYQAKIIQYCFYHKPLKNSTVLHSPLPRQISTVYALKDPKLKQYRTYHYT